MPNVFRCYGLFNAGACVGVVNYAPPNNPKLITGVCGDQWAKHVLELNRLVVTDGQPNAASMLVGRSIRLLPKPSVIVSYADATYGHVGYIYQATNFIYTGCPEAHQASIKIDGIPTNTRNLGSQFGKKGKFKGLNDAKEKLGDRLEVGEREKKHRYIYLHGSKRDKKAMMRDLRYGVEPYPKGPTRRFEPKQEIETQLVMI